MDPSQVVLRQGNSSIDLSILWDPVSWYHLWTTRGVPANNRSNCNKDCSNRTPPMPTSRTLITEGIRIPLITAVMGDLSKTQLAWTLHSCNNISSRFTSRIRSPHLQSRYILRREGSQNLRGYQEDLINHLASIRQIMQPTAQWQYLVMPREVQRIPDWHSSLMEYSTLRTKTPTHTTHQITSTAFQILALHLYLVTSPKQQTWQWMIEWSSTWRMR